MPPRAGLLLRLYGLRQKLSAPRTPTEQGRQSPESARRQFIAEGGYDIPELLLAFLKGPGCALRLQQFPGPDDLDIRDDVSPIMQMVWLAPLKVDVQALVFKPVAEVVYLRFACILFTITTKIAPPRCFI